MTEISKLSDFSWKKDTVAAFTAEIKGSNAENICTIPKGEKPSSLGKNQKIISFEIVVDELTDWHNGQTYLDTMNSEAVREFIKVTHEAYRKNCGNDFGKTVPGIFTDEPYRSHVLAKRNDEGTSYSIPWTEKLPQTFKKLYGYDLIPHLPEIFFDLADMEISRARYHYHDCVTNLFVNSFAKQIGDWCGKNKLQFTGHVLEEDTLKRQTNVVGNCMRFYEHMQAPGMDLLTEHWRIYTTAKQVSSAARQFGRKWRLTETYGCTGWDFPFLGHKALGDWQVALGINLRCQHLAWFSMQGESKRDYPSAISYQSPWWNCYSKVENYFARINSVMTKGLEVRDLLVIHPIESMWTLAKKDWSDTKEVLEFDSIPVKIENILLNSHIDFDYGDEELLSRHAKIAKDKGSTELKFCKATYKCVLVPPLRTMRSSTLSILKKFKEAGGTVVFAGAPATHLDAIPSSEIAEFASKCVLMSMTPEELPAELEKTCRRISILNKKDGKEVAEALYLLREDKDALYLFICNTGDNKNYQTAEDTYKQSQAIERKIAYDDVSVEILSGFTGKVLELDPDNGSISQADSQIKNGICEIRTSLPKLGSRLFVLPKKNTDLESLATSSVNRKIIPFKGDSWQYQMSESNNLVLDRPKFRIGGNGKGKAPEEILRIDREVRKTLGIKARGGAMVQPWARKSSGKNRSVPVELLYNFDIDTLPSGELHLAIEKPDKFKIIINGTPVNTDMKSGWWTDLSLIKVPFSPSLLKKGENEVLLSLDYDENFTGLEIVYILGNFGVKVEGWDLKMTSLPEKLRLGDWCKQGLPFYSGNISYISNLSHKSEKGSRSILQIPEYHGVAVKVIVNGKEAGIVAWEPNELDITDFLKDGGNEIRIEVLGHRRNSHGPFHYFEKWPTWTGPGQFVPEGANFANGYQIVPCGLM